MPIEGRQISPAFAAGVVDNPAGLGVEPKAVARKLASALHAAIERRCQPKHLEQPQLEPWHQPARILRSGYSADRAGEQRVNVGKRLVGFAERIDRLGHEREHGVPLRLDERRPRSRDDLCRDDDLQRAAPMHLQRTLSCELQTPRKMTAQTAHAFGDRIELSALQREERYDPVGFGELASA